MIRLRERFIYLIREVPHIDRLAHEGEPSIKLPRAWLEDGSYDFSFSGLKSAVINTVHNAEQRGESIRPEDLAASFQDSVIDVLVTKTVNAVKEYKVKQLLLAGGVAANKGLRSALEEAFNENKEIELVIPPLNLCTDNAAMIAAAGAIMFNKGVRSDLALNANPGLDIAIHNNI